MTILYYKQIISTDFGEHTILIVEYNLILAEMTINRGKTICIDSLFVIIRGAVLRALK